MSDDYDEVIMGDDVDDNESVEDPMDDDDDNIDIDRDHNAENLSIAFASDNQVWTTPVLTKYEMAALLGMRATMLSKGMPALVSVTPDMSYEDIAKEELRVGKMPLMISRPVPTGPNKFTQTIVRPGNLIH